MLAISETTKDLLSVAVESNEVHVLQNAIRKALSNIESSTEKVDIRELFDFESLSDKAKETALDAFRDINVNYDGWSDYEQENFSELMEKQGFNNIDISYSGFGSQGDGASFTCDSIDIMKYLKANKKLTKYRLLKNDIADGLSFCITRYNTNYYHANTITISSNYCGYSTTKIENLVNELMDEILDTAKDASKQLYNELYDLYYDLISDDLVIEAIISNEYTFDINGKQII